MTKKKIEIEKKKVGARSRSLFDEMRSVAWVKHLISETGCKSPNALMEKTVEETDSEIRFNRYLSGKATPTEEILELMRVDMNLPSSRLIFDVGPKEGDDVVELWSVFQSEQSSLKFLVSDELARNGVSLDESNFLDAMAYLYVSAEQWNHLCGAQLPSNMIIAEFGQQYQKSKHFDPSLRRLVALIAIWRISMHTGRRTKQLQLLLTWFLKQECGKELERQGIYSHICALLKALAVDHYLTIDDLHAAEHAFDDFRSVIDKLTETKKMGSSRKGVVDDPGLTLDRLWHAR